jgi:hypothetical protein
MKAFDDTNHKEALLFLLGHLAAGIVGALVVGTLLLWLDVGGLATLMWRSEHPWVAVGMLFFGLVITFGGCAAAAGVMGMKTWRDRAE